MKITNYKIILSLAILSFIFISPVLAQSSDDKPQRPSTKSAVPEKIQEKLLELQEKRESTKPGELQRLAAQKEIKSRAWSGVIKSISGNSIFIASKDGSREIRVSDQTRIVRAERKESIGFSDLKVGDFVMAMGQVNGNILGAKLIMVTPAKKPETRRHAVHGIVQSIMGQTLTLKHPKQDKTYQVLVGTDTKIKIKGLELPTLTDIKVGDRVTATGTIENNVLTARHLFVIPGKAQGLQKTSTPTRLPKLSSPAASE